jgi:hypothetical protein
MPSWVRRVCNSLYDTASTRTLRSAWVATFLTGLRGGLEKSQQCAHRVARAPASLGTRPAAALPSTLAAMSGDELRDRWNNDAGALAQIGAALFPQPTRVTVKVPAELAEAAVTAWNREDIDEDSDREETAEEATTRARAGSFALIGAAVESRGEPTDDGHVTVDLDAWFIGHALDAADDAGLVG